MMRMILTTVSGIFCLGYLGEGRDATGSLGLVVYGSCFGDMSRTQGFRSLPLRGIPRSPVLIFSFTDKLELVAHHFLLFR
jgi:hypothetical protein